MRKEPLFFQPNGMKFVPQLYLTDRPGKQHLLAAFESETRLILGLRKSITINKKERFKCLNFLKQLTDMCTEVLSPF